jgi:hypothetical protein
MYEFKTNLKNYYKKINMRRRAEFRNVSVVSR